jgi:nucleotide-binding universal stress UspA family protein
VYHRILVPTDGSEITQIAIRTAVGLAKSLGAAIYVVAVKEPYPFSAISEMSTTPPQEFLDSQERLVAKRIKVATDACMAAKIPCQGYSVEATNPWEAIIDTARLHECDLVVMASHGRGGVSALLLGSETQKVLTHCKVPVLVVR